MLSSLKQLLSPSPVKQQAFAAYVNIVAQARKPIFYKEWQVEDTIDGRFDVIVLHLFLIISRCDEDADYADFIRHLKEAFFSDMDRSLREMGASDTGVGIRVKKMAQAFYGRLKAYKESAGDEALLTETIKRNVYREKAVSSEDLAALTSYMISNIRSLQLQTLEAVTSGNIVFSSYGAAGL